MNVLITAGLTGIGKELNNLLTSLGMKVYLTTSRQNKTSENIFFWDMKSPNSTSSLIKQIKERNIKIDTLIHCAHVFSDTKLSLSIKDDEFLGSIEANIGSTFSLTRDFSKLMARQKQGKIILLGSLVAQRGGPGKATYIIEKNAYNGICLALQSEFKDKNLLYKILHPGIVETEQVKNKISEEVLKLIGDKILSASEVANKINELIHDMSEKIIYEIGTDQKW